MTSEGHATLPLKWPDIGELSDEDIATYENIKWHFSETLVMIRRSHENAEQDGKAKERAVIAEYLDIVGLPTEAQAVRECAYRKMLPKERRTNG